MVDRKEQLQATRRVETTTANCIDNLLFFEEGREKNLQRSIYVYKTHFFHSFLLIPPHGFINATKERLFVLN